MFDENFEVVLADTQTARRINYQVRYQVYCLEEGFEDHERFPDGEESDNWDKHSAHFLVRSKQTDEWVAAMRLVLPNPMGLPMDTVCEIDATLSPARAETKAVEVSRLCIVDGHRRLARPSSGAESDAAATPQVAPETSPGMKQPQKSEIVMGLMRAATVYCRQREIPYWYFLSTSVFSRMMSRLGFQSTRVGPACEHRGERFPFLINHLNAYSSATQALSPMTKMLLKNTCAYRRFSELGVSTADCIGRESLVA